MCKIFVCVVLDDVHLVNYVTASGFPLLANALLHKSCLRVLKLGCKTSDGDNIWSILFFMIYTQ